MKPIAIADRLIEKFGRWVTGMEPTEAKSPLVYDRCSRCGLLMPTGANGICACWNTSAGRYWEGRWRDEAKENDALRADLAALKGHKEEADRHIRTIAELRADNARMAASFVNNQNVIKAAVAAERERCAKIAEAKDSLDLSCSCCDTIAAAIRRGEP